MFGLGLKKFIKEKLHNFKYEFSDFTSSEKAYLSAQVLWLISLVITITLVPLAVKVLTGDTALTGVARAAYFWSIAVASLWAGGIVKAYPMRNLLITTTVMRCFLFSLLTILLLTHVLTFQIFLIIISVLGIVLAHSHLIDLDQGGANQIFSSAKKKEKGLYFFMVCNYLSLLTLPILLGPVVDLLEKYVGPGSGIAFGFFLFAVLMFLSAMIYYRYLEKIPVEARVKQASQRYGLKRSSQLINLWCETPKRLFSTIKIVWQNSAILLRFNMVVFEQFIDDALMMVVLPTFALDILQTGMTGNSLLLTAMNLGGFLAARVLLMHGQRLQKTLGLYKFFFILAFGASFAFLPSIVFWAYPSLWAAIPAVILLKFLYEPIRCRMDLLLQLEIASDVKAKSEEANIFSLLTLCDTVSTGFGGLFFAWLFINSSPGTSVHALLGANAPMKMITLILMAYSLLTVFGLLCLKKHIYRHYRSAAGTEATQLTELSANLKSLNLEPYRTEIVHSAISPDRPTIAFLAPPSLHQLSILRQGGKQAAGDIHLVLDSDWIMQELQPDNNHRLYLKKGLYFDGQDDAVLIEYKIPRLIRHFVNYYTDSRDSGINGLPLEAKLDTPMSSSAALERLINEKVLTRYWLSQNEGQAPASLAFLMRQHPMTRGEAPPPTQSGDMLLFEFPSVTCPNQHQIITESVNNFLNSRKLGSVVVKPSGVLFPLPYKVEYFSSEQVDQIVDHILNLSVDQLMTSDGSIIVEERLFAPPLYIEIGKDDHSGRFCLNGKRWPIHILSKEEIAENGDIHKMDWCLQILVSRTPWEKGVTTEILARMGGWGKPLNPDGMKVGQDRVFVPFEDIVAALREQQGFLKTEEEKWLFEKDLEALGSKALLTIASKEKEFPKSPDAPLQAQTDYIGLELIIIAKDGKLIPKIIAVSSQRGCRQYQFDQFYPDRIGEHSRMWIATMLARARRNALSGKRIALVGSGYEAKKPYFDRAKELGIEIVLIDQTTSWAKNIVAEYIPMDTAHPDAHSLAYQSLLQSIKSKGQIDGITTFWENDVVLTAQISRDLNLFYFNVDSAITARNKFKMRKAMKSVNLPVPLFFLLHSAHELDQAISIITRVAHATGISPFPMVLKPTGGAASQFTFKVRHAEELREVFNRISEEINSSKDSIFERNKLFILEEYIGGFEWDVDLVIQDEKVKYYSITDNWEALEPLFLSPGDSLPSYRLSPEAQHASIKLAIETVQALNIRNGVLHVEGKYDPIKGPHILEVNGRPAGLYLTEWQKIVWGIDIIELLYATAANVPIFSYRSDFPLTYLEGETIFPDKSGILNKVEGIEELSKLPGYLDFKLLMPLGEYVHAPPKGSEAIVYLVAEGKDRQTALENFRRLKSAITILID